MITNRDAVQNSLQKYCYNKQFAIASKSSEDWTKMYFGETIPLFDVEDETYWLVSTGDYETWIANQSKPDDSYDDTPKPPTTTYDTNDTSMEVKDRFEEKEISKLVISGSANAIAFNQLFQSFVMPLKENNVKIEFKISAKSNPNYPITKNSQQYKIVKESASQMGFDIEEE